MHPKLSNLWPAADVVRLAITIHFILDVYARVRWSFYLKRSHNTHNNNNNNTMAHYEWHTKMGALREKLTLPHSGIDWELASLWRNAMRERSWVLWKDRESDRRMRAEREEVGVRRDACGSAITWRRWVHKYWHKNYEGGLKNWDNN